MSRPFAIVIIVVSSFLLACSGAYCLYATQRENTTFQLRTLELNQRLITQSLSDLEQSDIAVRYQLEDDTKQRFRHVLAIFDAGEAVRNKYINSINTTIDYSLEQNLTQEQRNANLLRLQALADSSIQFVLHTSIHVFNTHGESMDLRAGDVEAITSSFTQMVAKTPPLDHSSGSISENEYMLRRDWLTLSFLHTLGRLLESSNSFFCSRGYRYATFYPVVLNNNNRFTAGKTEMLKIGLGSYSTRLKPENVDLKVNGKQLKIGKTGLAEISVPGKKRGKHSLHFSVGVRDEYTKDTTYSESIYHYVIE